jgi:hypothetical protein
MTPNKRAMPNATGRRLQVSGAVVDALAAALPLVILGMVMLYSDRLFTFVDDEALVLSAAAQPLRASLHLFFAGWGALERPPLYDIWLHLWLRITGGAFVLLRAPSMIFFLAGLWILSRAARRIGGPASAAALLWAAVFWPYGFHYGRLASWYSFTFLLICAVTWAYLRLCATPSVTAWAIFFTLAVALVYTNYAGWALLALLAVDNLLRHRGPGELRMPYVGRLVGTAALVVLAYAPLWRVLIPRLGDAVDPHATWKLRLLTAGYNAYALVVSESVAPWFWRFGIPATVGIAAGFTLALVFLRGETRRWLIFGAVLLAGMDVLGLLQAKWLFLVAPWFLLPIAVLFGTMKHPYWRAALVLSLAIPAAIGWYGVYSRHYYSQQRFLEPWASISVQAVQAIHDGGFIIGDNPSFFFYLTYALPAPPANSSWRFSGSLPEAVHHPQVWSPSDWQAAGQPIAPYMLWVHGTPNTEEERSMEEAGQALDHRCGDRVVRYLVRDTGNGWKQRLFPGANIFWRIEIRQYACDQGGGAAPPADSGRPGKSP